MMDGGTGPERRDAGQLVSGVIRTLWHCKAVPESMRPARLEDLRLGVLVMYQVQIGPDKGEYYTCYYSGSFIEPIKNYVKTGVPVYVQKSRYEMENQ